MGKILHYEKCLGAISEERHCIVHVMPIEVVLDGEYEQSVYSLTLRTMCLENERSKVASCFFVTTEASFIWNSDRRLQR